MRCSSLLLVLGLMFVAGEAAGATLYRRLEAEPNTLNPILATTEFEEIVLANVSRNLIDIDEHLQTIPGLCDHWSVSPDLRRYTLHLRQDATWEDGKPITAHDAAVTLRLVTDPRTPALRFAPALESLSAIHERDEKTLDVEFAHPYALRLYAFHIGLLRASRYEHRDVLTAPENRMPVASGPYRVRIWKAGQEIVLVRNDHYWGARPAYDRIVFRILPEQAQAYRALLRGELDETRLSAEEAAHAADDHAFAQCCRLLQYPNLSYLYIAYNERNPLFRDPATRRALTMLVDRQAMVDHLYGGAGRVLSGPWPTALPAYDERVPPYPFDPPAARALLMRAGWQHRADSLQRDGLPFRFQLLFTATSATSREIAEIVQASLAAAGVSCALEPVEWPILTDRLARGEFDAAVLAFANDVNPDLFEQWHSSQAAPHGLNAAGLWNPSVDRLIEAARSESDPVQRTRIFHELHRLMHDLEPATWLFEVSERHAVARRVGGISVSPLGLFRFWPGGAAWHPD